MVRIRHIPRLWLTMIAQTFRKLNAVVVPMMVKVPKTEEEDLKMRNEREKNAQQPPSTGAGTGSST